MKMKKIGIFTLGLLILVNFNVITSSAASTNVELTISFTNLAPSGNDHYEGWLIVDGSPVSTGKFVVDANGGLTDLNGDAISTFNINGIDLALTVNFVLSLEPSGDSDAIPSDIKPLAGDLSADKSSATLSHNIGADFSSVEGSYILATPTNGADTDENSGIWFLDPTGAAPVAGLTLPDLTNTDWIYEGWTVIDGTPVSTGTFNTVEGIDDADPFSSTEAGPPFPGEDFLINAPSGLTFPTDIAGDVAVISIEPKMDNDAAPFQFKPLVGNIPVDAVDHVLYDMDDNTSAFASGTVSIAQISEKDDSPGFSFFMIMSFLLVGVTILRFQRKDKNH